MGYLKLKKEDNVRIIGGKDKGKSGQIVRIDHKKGRIIVRGLNMVKKTVRPKRQNDKGGIIDQEAFMDASSVMIVCKKCGITRIGFRLEGKGKVRICKKCKEAL